MIENIIVCVQRTEATRLNHVQIGVPNDNWDKGLSLVVLIGMTFFSSFQLSTWKRKLPLVVEAQKEHRTCFSEVRILREKIHQQYFLISNHEGTIFKYLSSENRARDSIRPSFDCHYFHFNRAALGRERVKLDFSNVILKKWVYPHLFKGSPKWITADFAEIFRRINVESRFWKYFPAKLHGTFLNKKEIYSLPLFDLIYSAGKTHKTSNYSQWSRLNVHTNLAYHSYPRNCISSVKRSHILIARILIAWSLKIEDFPAATCFWVNQRTCFVNN